MDWINLLNDLPWIDIIGWIVGVVGISLVSLIWNTVKKGRKMYKYYYEAKEDGWTEAEKDQYIEKSAAFFQSVNTLWNAIFNK